MSKRKLTTLVQLISLYSSLNEPDRLHFADFIRSQQPPRKKGVKGSGKKSQAPILPSDGEANKVSLG